MVNILVSGLYASGSSAVVDLLSEYDGIKVLPGEFEDVRRAGMLGDYIEGKISKGYPSNIIHFCSNYGGWIYRYTSFRFLVVVKRILLNSPLAVLYKKGLYDPGKKKRLLLLKKTSKQLQNELKMEDKILIGKGYITGLQKIYNTDKENKFMLFDAPIFYNSHKNIWPKLFEPYKLIIVIRDPRDQIAQLSKDDELYLDMETPTRALLDIYGDTREGALKYQIDALIARYTNAMNLEKMLGKSSVLVLRFEDLVLKYEMIVKEIENFLGLKSVNHKKVMQTFKPEESRKNIGIFRTYLTNEELKLFSKVENLFYQLEDLED